MSIVTGYIGTYHSSHGEGIYRFRADASTGTIQEMKLYYRVADAKYAAIAGSCLIAPVSLPAGAGLMLLPTNNTIVTSCTASITDRIEQAASCFITHVGGKVYTANYHEGCVLVYSIKNGRLHFVQRIDIAPKAGCHQVILYENRILVPCLELDEIRIFDCESRCRPTGKIVFPSGSGPRHGALNRSHTRLYVVGERSNELFVFSVSPTVGPETGFTLLETHSLLPPGTGVSWRGASAAAIRLSTDERFAYVSVRGADLITVWKLPAPPDSPAVFPEAVPVQYASCGGCHPRDIVLLPNGNFLLVVNRYSNELVSLPVDSRSGRIGPAVSGAFVPEGVSIVLQEDADTNH